MSYKMREIELKNLEVGDEGVKEAINYKVIITGCLTNPKNPQAGTTTKEIREVSPILDLLDDAEDGDKIHLTESQWASLKDRLKTMTINQNLRAFVHLEDDVINAKEIEVKPLRAVEESGEA